MSPVYTKQETAERLRIGLRTLERRIATGEITYRRDGRRVLFTEGDIAQHLERCRVERRPA